MGLGCEYCSENPLSAARWSVCCLVAPAAPSDSSPALPDRGQALNNASSPPGPATAGRWLGAGVQVL
eukprot:6157357-Pleurochrysis_carterae.AAC.2